MTPQCASSKQKGMLFHCYSSPTVWVALGTAVVDLLCVEPGPNVWLIGRIRKPTQEAGRGSSCGALSGSQCPRSSDVTWNDQLKGNILVKYVTLVPWRREQRRHVPSPQLLYHSWAAASALQRKACINAVHLLPLIITLWSAAAGCELPHANVHRVV